MKYYLTISLICLFNRIAFAQPASTLIINQSVSFTALNPGNPLKVVLNTDLAVFHQAQVSKVPIDVMITITDVPVAIASNLRLGSAQKPESIDTVSNGLATVVFKQGWLSVLPQLAVSITNLALPADKLGVRLIEPAPAPVGVRALKTPVAVTADENDAFIIDLCPGSTQPLRYPKGRSWAYVRPHEQTRMVVKRINPLRNGVSLNIETIAFNTDQAVALQNVSGILSVDAFKASGGGVNVTPSSSLTLTEPEEATRKKLRDLLAISDTLNEEIGHWRTFECLDDAIIAEITLAERRVKNLLKPYPNVAWLDLGLKRLATQVEAIAATKSSPLKETLLDGATYAKRDGLAKEIYGLLGQLGVVADATTLSTPLVEVNDYPNSDVLRFTLTKTNRLDSTSRSLSKFYDVWVIGRAKLDFSAGLVVSGLVDQTRSVIDEVVSQTALVDGVSKTVNVVRQRPGDERTDKTSLALATMGHLYWRTAWFKGGLNVGLSLGAGITTKGRPIYLAGGSLLLGRQQRVVLSGGAAVGTQQELSARYDQTSNYYPSDPAAFTYIDRTKVRGFFGVTVNFGKNEKKETILGK